MCSQLHIASHHTVRPIWTTVLLKDFQFTKKGEATTKRKPCLENDHDIFISHDGVLNTKLKGSTYTYIVQRTSLEWIYNKFTHLCNFIILA